MIASLAKLLAEPNTRKGGTMLNVVVDIFSGRPDPSFVVEGTEANQVLQQISANRGVMAALGSGRQGLGYRGVRIEILAEQDTQKYDFPEVFMIATGVSADESKGMDSERLVDILMANLNI